MLKYYVPLLYTFETRYKSVINIVSFFIVNVLPSFYFATIYHSLDFNICVYYFMAFLAMHSIYECGYIFNDLITIRYENSPTRRINDFSSTVLLRHLQNLITLRCVLVICLTSIMFNKYGYNGYFTILLIILGLDYSLHNFIRNKFNILTMCVMVSLKYLIPCVMFLKYENIFFDLTILFVSVPLIRTIEYAAKSRYKLDRLKIRNYEIFRVKYYFIANLFLWLWFYANEMDFQNLIIIFILLLFRIASLFAVKNKSIENIIRKNRENNGNISKL